MKIYSIIIKYWKISFYRRNLIMNKIKKIAAGLTAFSVAATMAACSAPAIGSGTSEAVTIDGYEVKSGVFILYKT